MSNETELDQVVESLFDAERRVREIYDVIGAGKPDAVFGAVQRALDAVRSLKDGDEASLRLECMAVLVGEQGGSRAIDLLIDILGFEHASARQAAGEQLEQLGLSRFRELARGIERALDRLPTGSPALSELPLVLGTLADDGIIPLLRRFLRHQDANAVASALEVVIELGEPSLVEEVGKLRRDRRKVQVLGEQDRLEEITLGELVEDALEALESEAEEDPHPTPRGDDPRKS